MSSALAPRLLLQGLILLRCVFTVGRVHLN